MDTIRKALNDWTEIEAAIDVFAVAYGFLKPGEQFPKHYYWSRNTVVDTLSHAIFKMVAAGILEQRDGQGDTELRWNPDFRWAIENDDMPHA